MHALYLDYGAYRVKSSSLPRCTSEFVVSNQTQQKKNPSIQQLLVKPKYILQCIPHRLSIKYNIL